MKETNITLGFNEQLGKGWHHLMGWRVWGWGYHETGKMTSPIFNMLSVKFIGDA